MNVWGRAGLVIALLATTPAIGSATTISLNEQLLNTSFEVGTLGACPTSWLCGGSGSVTEFAPTAAQYTPGSNGLTGSKINPDGSNVAHFLGTSTLTQYLTISYVQGTTYTLDFWLGNPLGFTDTDKFNVSLLVLENGNWVTDNLCGNGTGKMVGSGFTASRTSGCSWDLPINPPSLYLPANGTWAHYSITYTRDKVMPASQTLVGIQFSSYPTSIPNASGKAIDLDLIGPAALETTQVPVPEPATLTMLGIGALGLAARRRRQRT